MVGRSFYKVLTKEKEQVGEFVFAQFDENAGGIPHPSRTIISKKYGYIFNPWANGRMVFKSASASHATYKNMAKLSKENEDIKARFDFWVLRTKEELYDYESDPNALNNSIDDPKYAEIAVQLRKELGNHLKTTNDYVFEAFENRENAAFLNQWMKKQLIEVKNRQQSLRWKRGKNQSGPTKRNTKFYEIPSMK